MAGGRIRSALTRALAIGLTIAAATAIVALLVGSFDDTEGRIIGTSLGFSFFSAVAAAGALTRGAGRGLERLAGSAALGLASAAFAALLYAVWVQTAESLPWRIWGVISVAALVCSHAALVLHARRRTDRGVVRALVATSIVAALLDATFAVLAITQIVEHVDKAGIRASAVAGVLMLLTSALPPLIRRVSTTTRALPRLDLAAEVIASTDRMLASDPDLEVKRECERLREVARVRG